MRLRADQIPNHLAKSGLKPLYLIAGDEPLQLFETADAIRKQARAQQYEERVVLEVDKQFNWQSVLDETASMSLFASQKIMELKLGTFKPGREGGKIFQEYAANLAEHCLLLITANKLDKSAQNTKWFKALDQVGVTVLVWPIDNKQLPSWIAHRLKSSGKQIERPAAELIAQKVEGNLMAAKQEINKLVLLADSDRITVDDVMSSVVDSSRYDVFNLMESAYQGNIKRTATMLQGLQTEGLDPMAIYGPLMWEYRRLCKMAFDYQHHRRFETLFSDYKIWNDSRKLAIKSMLNRHSLNDLHTLLLQAINLDRVIKSADRINAWNELLQLLTSMALQPKQAR